MPSITSNGAADDGDNNLPPIGGVGGGKTGAISMGRGKPGAGPSNYHNYSMSKAKPAPMGARSQAKTSKLLQNQVPPKPVKPVAAPSASGTSSSKYVRLPPKNEP